MPDEAEPLGGRWQRLADAAGCVRVGTQRVLLKAGQMITPPHLHSAEEEIFHVLSGSATLWQDGSTCTVAAGDTIVHPPATAPHTLIGGGDGLEVLIFGTRLIPEHGVLPRTNVAWLTHTGVTLGTLELWGPSKPGEPPATEPQETHPLKRGHVVSRPASTRISHCLRSGEASLTYLAYGARRQMTCATTRARTRSSGAGSA